MSKQLLLFPEFQKYNIVKRVPHQVGMPWPRGMGSITKPAYFLASDLEEHPELKQFVEEDDNEET